MLHKTHKFFKKNQRVGLQNEAIFRSDQVDNRLSDNGPIRHRNIHHIHTRVPSVFARSTAKRHDVRITDEHLSHERKLMQVRSARSKFRGELFSKSRRTNAKSKMVEPFQIRASFIDINNNQK